MRIRQACLALDSQMALNRLQIEDSLIEPELEDLLPEQQQAIEAAMDQEQANG